MAMDGLCLRAAVDELSLLCGGKIDKVQQPEKDTLLFTVRTPLHGTKRLLVITHAENGRIQLTAQSYDNPMQAPAFCMLLRRRLVGGRILSIAQSGPDRVCTFTVQSRDDMLDEVHIRLIVELMGKHANVLLVDGDGKIIDCIRRISPSETTQRILMPGFAYEEPPRQEKLDPFTAPESAFLPVYESGATARALTERFEGVSKASAAALLAICPGAASLHRMFAAFSENRFAPSVLYDKTGEPVAVFPFLPGETGDTVVPCQSLSDAFERYYADRDASVRIRRHGASLRRAVENARSRAEHKRASYLASIEDAAHREQYRAYGECILANLAAAVPGASELAAVDYYADPPQKCAVPLDPSLTAQENAKKYFKQYRKSKLACEYAEAQLPAVNEELAYLEGQLQNIANCETLAELEEVREELIAQKYVKPEKKPQKKHYALASEPLSFTSSDGVTIRVGKNNRQNEQLTLRDARPENLWLHAKQITGSHVVIDCDGQPPERTLLEAATLAAWYSAAREATTVPVDYTFRKAIRKPSGTRPGMVTYATNRTLYVQPDAKLVRALQSGAPHAEKE